MILLDTHTLIWLDQGSDKLGRKMRALFDSALQEELLTISSISFWEIGMLINKGRLRLEMDIAAWRSDLLKSGLTEIPIDGAIAINSTRLESFHGDPADHLIVATAMQHSARLVTADKQILAWTGPLGRLDARL